MELHKQLGMNIKVLRIKHELTQEQLAERATLERSYMGAIERGERNISVMTLLKVAQALDCPPAELLEDVHLPKGKASGKRKPKVKPRG